MQNSTDGVLQYQKIAWVLIGLALIFVLWKHLLVALLAGLLVHELVYVLEPHLLRIAGLKGDQAKVSVVALLTISIITGLILLAIAIVHFFQAGSDNLPALMNKMAEILESSRSSLPSVIMQYIPSNVDELQKNVVQWLREHGGELRGLGREAGRALALVLVGMIVGAMIALRELKRTEDIMPFPSALAQRVVILAASFRQVVFAQTWIAFINALFTGLYIVVILPLFGVHLPFQKTMVALTLIFDYCL